jgi:tetratricopeptide (TPR) repeat protein
VDTENKLTDLFGFKIVPNAIFVDENGTIRLIKQGFHVSDEQHVNAIEQLIRGEVEQVTLEDKNGKRVGAAADLKIQLAQTKFKLGMEYSNRGKKEEGLKELDEALLLDPDNFVIRKQRWYIRHPEKFSPTIDYDWQKQQIDKERAAEAALACGPEGCEIPGTSPNTPSGGK